MTSRSTASKYGSLQVELEGGISTTPLQGNFERYAKQHHADNPSTHNHDHVAYFRTHRFTIFSRPTSSKHDAISPMSSSVKLHSVRDLIQYGTHTKGRVKSCSPCCWSACSTVAREVRQCPANCRQHKILHNASQSTGIRGHTVTPPSREQEASRNNMLKKHPTDKLAQHSATRHAEHIRGVPCQPPSTTFIWGSCLGEQTCILRGCSHGSDATGGGTERAAIFGVGGIETWVNCNQRGTQGTREMDGEMDNTKR